MRICSIYDNILQLNSFQYHHFNLHTLQRIIQMLAKYTVHTHTHIQVEHSLSFHLIMCAYTNGKKSFRTCKRTQRVYFETISPSRKSIRIWKNQIIFFSFTDNNMQMQIIPHHLFKIFNRIQSIMKRIKNENDNWWWMRNYFTKVSYKQTPHLWLDSQKI